MTSKWRWCANCQRWLYPDDAEGRREVPLCPVCQRPSVGADEAPGMPPNGGHTE